MIKVALSSEAVGVSSVRSCVDKLEVTFLLTWVAKLTVTSTTGDGNELLVSFVDKGMGIAAELQEEIFEPLFTTKAKGIGLGLALVKMLIEDQGGAVAVHSEVGKGSTFTITIPSQESEGETRAR